jgi:anti-sigma regulatory factor (Ser/Thr protein kinase)
MQANTSIRLAKGDHVVRFYEDEDDLVTVVTRYVGSALAGGEAAVVIATPAHAERFLTGFAEAGVDVAAAQVRSQLTVLDAEEALAAFAPEGVIDAAAFDAIMTPLVRRARESGSDVCAYGEMVAVLFDDGRPHAALELEACWNELSRREGFSLLCAYPAVPTFGADEDRTDAYADVCRLHSDVVVDQPQLDDAECSCAFARGPRAPRQARRFVTDILQQWDLVDLVDPARLIVSELATNAVVHAGSGFTVSLNHDGCVVRLAVGDGAAAVPQRAPGGLEAPRGRGIPIIEAVASRWGHLALDRGKLVWAELAGDSLPVPAVALR